MSGEVQQKISSELEYVKDEKKIPTEGQLSQITAALNKSFILSDLQALYHAKQEGDEETIQAAYRTLARRLKAIGDGYGIKVTIVQTSKEFL